jgi:hypothetical protein
MDEDHMDEQEVGRPRESRLRQTMGDTGEERHLNNGEMGEMLRAG